MTSLALFAGEYEGSAIRVTEDGKFSVYDVLVAFGVADKLSNSKNVLDRLAGSHPEVTTLCSNFKFPGRGQRETPVADEEGIYQILMLCPGKRGEEFRAWAAKIVRERREEENDPELAYNRGRQRAINAWKKQGLSDSHIQERLDGIQKRAGFTDRLKEHGVTGSGYGQCTNAIYIGLFETTAAGLREERGIQKTAPLRDLLDEDEVREIGISEDLAALRIKKKNVQGNKACAEVSLESAKSVKKFLDS